MDIALDPTTHDLAIDTAGNLSIVSGVDAIGQHLRMRLWLFRGELNYDTSAGLPYYESILTKPASLTLIESIYRDEVLATPGVLAIDNLELTLNRSTRELDVDFNATVTGGTVNYSDTIESE